MKPLLVLVLFLAQPAIAPVEAQLLPIRNYTTREGLNANSMSAVFRDSRGILWIGTYNGVNWYDGEHFLQPSMSTRSGQIYVTNFQEDKEQNVWVTTWYSGLYQYTGGRFINYLVDTVHIESQANNVFDILESDRGHYIIATDRNVWQFHLPGPGSGREGLAAFTRLDPANTDLDQQINSLALAGDHELLIGYKSGVARYRLRDNAWRYAGMLWQGASVNNILVRGDRCWLATEKGLYHYPSLSAALDTTSAGTRSPLPLYTSSAADHVCLDGSNNLWFSAGGGACQFSADTRRLQCYTGRNGIASGSINAIFADGEGITWVGTQDGLSRLNKEYYHFYSIGTPEATIISVNTDREGALWAGSYDALYRIQGERIIRTTRVDGTKTGFVYRLIKDAAGELWACSDAGILHITGDHIALIYRVTCNSASLASDGSIWFGCRNGLILHGVKNDIRVVTGPTDNNEPVSDIYCDSHGYVWVGYSQTGLKKFRPDPRGLTLVKEYSARTGYTNMRIRTLGGDGQGHLLAGTRTGGLYVFETDTSSADAPLHLTTGEGLSGNWIKAIATTPHHDIYLATNNGLDLLTFTRSDKPATPSPASGLIPHIHPIPFRDDRLPNEINAVYWQPDTIWLGLYKGVMQYIPSRVEKNKVPPPVYIMKVTVDGRTDSSFRPFTAQATLPDLPYGEGSIAFDFAGLSFREEANVRYRYQMEGLDKGWSPVTDRRYVNYSNLPPGNYRFHVIAGNDDDVWSEVPATLSFYIAGPFWRTGWFIGACLLSLAALLYIFYRYRLGQALKIERLRAKISTDLHDDIGSTLSSISIMSDMILQESRIATSVPERLSPQENMALEIRENSLSLMDKMDDIVWSINPRNDALENLMARIQRFGAQLFEAKGIEYEIAIENDIRRLRLPMEYRQHIYLIMKEAINNLAKYADAGKACIRAGSVSGYLQVSITDDGKGFDPATADSGNGIANMKDRAEEMRADLRIHSEPGRGTTVVLTLKIK